METDDYMNEPFVVSRVTISRADISNLYYDDNKNYEVIKEIIKNLSGAVMEKIAQRLGEFKHDENFFDNLVEVFKEIVEPEKLYQYYEYKLKEAKERKEN